MKLLIVDDHPVVREGLAILLSQAGANIDVVQATDATAALDIAAATDDLDGVLLDLAMPGLGGMAAIEEFGRRRPDLPLIVLSSSEDPEDVRLALAQGALGYVPKSATPSTLLCALRLVMDGEIYVPPLMLAARKPDKGARSTAAPLTDRQIDVLRQLCEGRPNKTIAHALQLSEKTVKAHITAIFKALNVVNRSQAVAAARDAGLV